MGKEGFTLGPEIGWGMEERRVKGKRVRQTS